MTHRLMRGCTVLLALLGLAGVGCETPKTNIEVHMGDAYRHAKEQTLAAGRDENGELEDPISLDGSTAQGVMVNFRLNEHTAVQTSRDERVGISTVSDKKD